ncbi:MAG: AmmeMemoRadiSam system protein A [Nanoarchaeota archaeon]|nr:AmmeMemoRadiSam system protein A [Nanoarchaeota archaeon]MBU1005328.1 AmmeMemoRadiSam system protein A [Nanoarchaeota archaeon]MBU1945500.1 AmmeMemoRadiSam system protein A [Nanoarchaeota archaeon]
MSLAQGKKLIKLARDSISSVFSDTEIKVKDDIKKEFSEELGVFVTLNKHEELRGCIGFPEPVYPLYNGVIEAAKNAAFSDPRFNALDEDELKEVTVEVSVLTKPKQIIVEKVEDYVKKVKVGRDGLIVRSDFGSGLLLPQVATEYKWDSKTFLEQTCNKAGLPVDMWKDNRCKIYSFQSQVFSEIKPSGEVKQLM